MHGKSFSAFCVLYTFGDVGLGRSLLWQKEASIADGDQVEAVCRYFYTGLSMLICSVMDLPILGKATLFDAMGLLAYCKSQLKCKNLSIVGKA